MSKNFNKMKVAELRKFVSENNIFSGGLSTLKKKDIIDKIYESEYYHLNYRPVDELTERQQLELKLKMLEDKLKTESKEVVEPKEVVKEPESEVVKEPESEVVKEPEPEVIDDRIQKAVNEALLKQKENFINRLFS
jgi:hypothetical protein